MAICCAIPAGLNYNDKMGYGGQQYGIVADINYNSQKGMSAFGYQVRQLVAVRRY
jgi:hypothetical protein